MQEYQDGSFGEIQERESLIEKLASSKQELDKTKAIHFGTKEELEEIREKDDTKFKMDVSERLSRLEQKMNQVLLHFNIKWDGIL